MEIKAKVECEKTTDVLCDICGKSTLYHYKEGTDGVVCTSIRYLADYGYDSPRDGKGVWADLCQECALKIEQFILTLGGTLQEVNRNE